MAKKKTNIKKSGSKKAKKPKSVKVVSKTVRKSSAKSKNNQKPSKSKSKVVKKVVKEVIKNPKSGSKANSSKQNTKPNSDWRASSATGESSSTTSGSAPKTRSALGRGLSALLGGTLSRPAPTQPVQAKVAVDVTNNPEKSNTWDSNKEVLQADITEIQEGNVLVSEVIVEKSEEVYQPNISSSYLSEAVSEKVLDAEFTESREDKSFSERQPGTEYSNLETSEDGLVYVSLASLAPNPNQPRKNFDETEIGTLADSIKESGLLQPILVRRTNAQVGVPFQVVAGERRYRAAIKAGLAQVPVIIKNLTDKETLQIGIIENVQRADLNPIEEALAYRKLIDEFGENQADVAKAVGKDRTSIANALRILKLPEQVVTMISYGQISSGHGRALLMIENEKKQISLAKKIWKEGLSVRAVERLCSKTSAPKEQKSQEFPAKSPILMDIEDRLRRALGTKITLNVDDSGKGELRVNFYSQGELENLLDRLGA